MVILNVYIRASSPCVSFILEDSCGWCFEQALETMTQSIWVLTEFLFCFSSYEPELNPGDHQKTNVLKYQMEKRPFFDMPSHLADVDLDEYDYEEDFE